MGELLAKPDVPLVEHLRAVLLLGMGIADRLGLGGRLRMQALLACVMHDIGKATTTFQDHMHAARDLQEALSGGAPEKKVYELKGLANQKKSAAYPHALASLPFCLVAECHLAQQHGWEGVPLAASGAVLTHHTPLRPGLYAGYVDRAPDFHPHLASVLEDLYELLRYSGLDSLPSPREFLDRVARLIKPSPAAVLHDAGISFNGGGRTSILGLLQRVPVAEFARVKAVLHLADWLASAKDSPIFIFLSDGRRRVLESVSSFVLKEFQQKAANDRADVLWLRAPTGTGKTEALLLWAGDADRLLYLLPTQATVNAMWRRLQDAFGHGRVGLAHGRAEYMLRQETDQDPLNARLFGSVFARPVTVGTLDQYLLAHLHGRHWEERRTLARQATVILDEIHAYEPYTLGLLRAALERERPARLALASATLPSSLLALFPQGTLVEAEPELWARCRHRLELHDAPLETCTGEILAAARAGRRVLVVANTVQQAQQTYMALTDALEPGTVHLLHSRFILRHRQQKESRAVCPAPGTVVVATQVIEVSLNISYDLLFTELAPIDALVQRMGRVNRFGGSTTAPVHVFCRPSEGSQYIYGPDVLQGSMDLLRELPSVPSDAQMAEATQQLYERLLASPEWHAELQAGYNTLCEVQDTLGCYTLDLSDAEMQQRFSTRKGHISVDVLPAAYVREAEDLQESGDAWRLVELMVPVPIYWIKQSACFTSLPHLGCLQTTLPYDPELGLRHDNN